VETAAYAQLADITRDPNGTFATNTWGRLAEVAWGSCSNSVPSSRAYTEEYSYDFAGDVIGKRLALLKRGNRGGAPGALAFGLHNPSRSLLILYMTRKASSPRPPIYQ
jgi:hypothetical protein